MLQQIINFIYRHPKANLKRIGKFGGYRAYRHMLRNSALMEKAAFNLPPVVSDVNGLPIYFLTGKNFLHQTLFCIQSLIKATPITFKLILVDDGSFTPELIGYMKLKIKHVVVIDQQQIQDNLDAIIPVNLYPALRQKRTVYPHLKKLTDIHTIAKNGWKLVLDSDMIFWHQPDEIINWLNNPTNPLHMIDCQPAYGYTAQLMQQLSGSTIKSLINVGAIGLNSSTINWDYLENWITGLENAEGTTYYLEQALTAMIIGESETTVLPAGKYIVNPTCNDIKNENGVLHHYVDLSKKGYFNEAWKKIIQPDAIVN